MFLGDKVSLLFHFKKQLKIHEKKTMYTIFEMYIEVIMQ